MKVTGMVEDAANLHGQRMNAYDSWSDAIGKAKTNKDAVGLSAAKKKAESSLKQISQQMGELQTQLKSESPETAEKVTIRAPN